MPKVANVSELAPDKPKRKRSKSADNCIVPGPVPYAVLEKAVLKRSEFEEQSIREYVEWQAPDENILHLEKIATERLLDRRLDAWDVQTDHNRWWVITNPTNLYPQELFPSLDYTLSFHVGVTTRMMAERNPAVPKDQQQRLAVVWRRWTQAAEALDEAEEAEDFQAVGMRCRECLITLVKKIADDNMLQEGIVPPKGADFVQWSEIIANSIARGGSAEEIRGYLKSMAKSTWQLVNWLTHAANAVRFDGHMAVNATEGVLAAFSEALIRHESGMPDRCPNCRSYRITTTYRPDLNADKPYVPVCESCGWGAPPLQNSGSIPL